MFKGYSGEVHYIGSDSHGYVGNLELISQGVTPPILLGDFCEGSLEQVDKAISWFRENEPHCVRGNREDWLISEDARKELLEIASYHETNGSKSLADNLRNLYDEVTFLSENMDDEDIKLLKSIPKVKKMRIDGKKVWMVHDTLPAEEIKYSSNGLTEMLEGKSVGRWKNRGNPGIINEEIARIHFRAPFDILFFGHTHFPQLFIEMDGEIEERRFFSASFFEIPEGARFLFNPGALANLSTHYVNNGEMPSREMGIFSYGVFFPQDNLVSTRIKPVKESPYFGPQPVSNNSEHIT